MTTSSIIQKKLLRKKGLISHSYLDLISLIVASTILLTQIHTDSQKAFILTLVGTSFIVWLFTQYNTNTLRELINNDRRVFFMPLLASMAALIILAIFRMYYSGTLLITFMIIWTTLIFLSRYFIPSYPFKFATIEYIENLNEVAYKNVIITPLNAPTEEFKKWDAIILDPNKTYTKEWLNWLSHVNMMGIPTISLPILIEALTNTLPTEMLNGHWVNAIFKTPNRYAPVKRLLDIVATIIISPILLPIFILIALLVYLDGGKPIIFKQKRLGKNNKSFIMYKFRSMRQDSEKNGSMFASKGDLRITKLGAILRKYRLDELPQFWNVLKGDMSIIGPRPEQNAFAAEFSQTIPLYDLRHTVRPGITGWAQVHQGYAAGEDETIAKLRYDLYYVKNHSLNIDIHIVLKTVLTILTGFGSR